MIPVPVFLVLLFLLFLLLLALVRLFRLGGGLGGGGFGGEEAGSGRLQTETVGVEFGEIVEVGVLVGVVVYEVPILVVDGVVAKGVLVELVIVHCFFRDLGVWWGS